MLQKSWIMGLVFLTVSGCGDSDDGRIPGTSSLRERWDRANDPIRMLPSDYVLVFDALPLKGNLEREPWADSYWPSMRGGLAHRWLSGVDGHEVTPVTLEAARTMSPKELSSLSPAEKFDIFIGNEKLPLFKSELERTSPNDGAWFGICHGWAPAALAFTEPKAVSVKGPSGIEVPFASSDIKALLSLYSAEYADVDGQMLASRCNDDFSKNPEAANKPSCRDTNAGAFHLVISNLLGIHRKGFVADLTRDLEVWNQPISGFETKIIKETRGRSLGASMWTAKEITVETNLYYGAEISPQWDSTGGNISVKSYRYRLELNRRGMVIGGEWLSERRPDFLWSNSTPKFTDTVSTRRGGEKIAWSELQKIYEAGIGATENIPDPDAER
jgi:hypothetical protein